MTQREFKAGCKQEGKMKSRFLVAFSAALALFVLAAPMPAQYNMLRAGIPFEFTVAGKAMPAGEYALESTLNSRALLLRNYDAGAAAIVVALRGGDAGRYSGQARITFNRYGDRYFLAQVSDGSSGSTFEIPKSREEQELARTASVERFEILATLARR